MKKRPRDPNQLAKLIVDLATMDETERDALQKRIAKKKSKTKRTYKPGKRRSSS